MKNKQTLLLGIGIVAIVAVLVLLFFRKPPPRIDWRPTYIETSKEPYGTFVITTLLQNYFSKGFETLKDSLPDKLRADATATSNYVFIGEGLFLDSMDVQNLLGFVKNGNTALLSSRTIPFDLMFYLYYEECEDTYWEEYSSFGDTAVQVNLSHPNLKTYKDFHFRHITRTGVSNYEWSYIDDAYFCGQERGFTELGRMNDSLINFAKIPYGKGTFYVHTTPLVFSNIAMLDSNSLQYANRVFSHLAPGKIYWDEYGKIRDAPSFQPPAGGGRALSKDSPLQYVLSQPPLAWSWYLLLAMALLYLLFRTKRKQRIIPVLETNTNTSLAFVSTIGRLYFLQNNHKQLSLQKMKLWLNFVRERYHLRGMEPDEVFQQKLIAKSEVSEVLIEKIFRWYHDIVESEEIVDQMLIEFHQLIEEFYRTCK